ncbi:MAG: flavoprotein [Planctomycetaceae bacterium]
MSIFANREILLGITGGIAAFKAADLCSKLVQQQARVSVVMTESAHRFIGATTFEALTGRPVNSDPFRANEHFRGEHIGLAQRAHAIVIAPATAQTMARLAHGFADDLLATIVLVATVPVFLAPAMNCDMWSKPSVQRNVEQLKADGHILIDPEDGWLSCGQIGPGRMASPETILAALQGYFESSKAM